MPGFSALLVVATSITLVVVQGTLFDDLRERGPGWWRELLSCPLCLGVWVGAVIWLFFRPDPVLLDHLPLWAGWGGEALGFGCITGVAALTVHRVWDALDGIGQ